MNPTNSQTSDLSQGVNWCFTINNPTQEDYQLLTLLDPANTADASTIIKRGKPRKANYMIFQLEQGKSGTIHYQGFVSLKTKARLTVMKKYMPRAHLELAIDPAGSIIYCQKPTDDESTQLAGPYEFGDINNMKNIGQRTDLLTMKAAIERGTSWKEIISDRNHFQTYIKYHNGLEKFKRIFFLGDRQRTEMTNVFALIGPTNTGKTHWVYNNFDDIYKVDLITDQKIWFDGYEGQKTVLIDDVVHLPLNFILKLCDKYPMTVEIKGGSVPFLAENVIFTSNNAIETWFPRASGANLNAFFRRIGTLYCWNGTLYEHIQISPNGTFGDTGRGNQGNTRPDYLDLSNFPKENL